MTRLATVLARAWLDATPEAFATVTEALVAAIPEPEREAMEAALDVCTFDGLPFPCPMRGSAHGSEDHPYKPLVSLGDPS